MSQDLYLWRKPTFSQAKIEMTLNLKFLLCLLTYFKICRWITAHKILIQLIASQSESQLSMAIFLVSLTIPRCLPHTSLKGQPSEVLSRVFLYVWIGLRMNTNCYWFYHFLKPHHNYFITELLFFSRLRGIYFENSLYFWKILNNLINFSHLIIFRKPRQLLYTVIVGKIKIL